MKSILRGVAFATLLAGGVGAANAACISLAAAGVPATENFDALSATAGSTTNVLGLNGWAMTETGGGARDNEQYGVDTGGSNTGDTYSYGSSGASDRALGSLRSGTLAATYGVCYTNDTGAEVTAFDIAYVGEQWRLGATARVDRLDFQWSTDATSLATGTWTNVDALDFSTPNTATTGAKDGNAAANRTALAASIAATVPAGGTVWLRWVDADATSADDGLAVDDLSVTAQGAGPSLPALSVGDATIVEGDAGQAIARFTLSLSKPGMGPVTFDLATADGTASSGTDYVGASTSYSVDAIDFPLTIDILVSGDTAEEGDETFFVNVSNVTGVNAADVQGLGTITNDDFVLTPIHAIQGNGATSPLAGTRLHTTGIVTGRKSNGFFLQAPDAGADADPLTSEGIYVFTGSAPSAAAAVGNLVRVSATVTEYIPSSDPGQLPLTELVSVTGVASLSAGNPLPTPVALSATFPDPAGPLDQLERLEGMRVTAPSFTVAGPTQGFTNEANATGTGNGILHAVVTGVARPHREAGIQAPDVPPGSGTVPPIPQWDFNPELLTIDSDGLGAAPLDLTAGSTIAGLVGPLDYGFRRYTVMRDAAAAVTVTAGPGLQAARVPTADEFTVASYNLERFFDTVNDPAVSETVLTATAYANRLNKASLGIRNYLHSPDILGVIEIENLTTLQDLAAKLNADAVAAAQPNPQYVAYLAEGNDIGGIDVGFLVKTADVAADASIVPRVEVVGLAQMGKDATWVQPDATTATLNDRPPYLLDAVVHYADGRAFPITAIVVHQRSLNGADTNDAGGERIRAKRQAQAEWLANELQAMQVADPARRLVVVGDFNAFEFNDGLVDAMGVVTGTPSPDNETAVAGDGVDLVDPNLVNLGVYEDAGEHYSFVFGGNAQSLDQALANEALLGATESFDFDHARINADFPEVARSDANSPSRLADHDPLLAYFAMAPLRADLSVSALTAASATFNSQVDFHVTVGNAGPDAAEFAGVGFAFNAELPGLSIVAPAGWSCDAPVVAGGETTLACSIDNLANGATASFSLTAPMSVAHAGRTITMVALATSTTEDPIEGNSSASATVAVGAGADLSVQWTGPTSASAGALNTTWRATVRNGAEAAIQPVVRLAANTLGANVKLYTSAGWTCVRTSGTQSFWGECRYAGAMAANATATFDLVIRTLSANRTSGVRLTADVTSTTQDPDSTNNRATFYSTVR